MAWQQCKRVGMTDGEIRVASELARNCTNRQIAKALSVTEKAVKSHVGRIYGKLRLTVEPGGSYQVRRYEAIQRLRDMGLGPGG